MDGCISCIYNGIWVGWTVYSGSFGWISWTYHFLSKCRYEAYVDCRFVVKDWVSSESGIYTIKMIRSERTNLLINCHWAQQDVQTRPTSRYRHKTTNEIAAQVTSTQESVHKIWPYHFSRFLRKSIWRARTRRAHSAGTTSHPFSISRSTTSAKPQDVVSVNSSMDRSAQCIMLHFYHHPSSWTSPRPASLHSY